MAVSSQWFLLVEALLVNVHGSVLLWLRFALALALLALDLAASTFCSPSTSPSPSAAVPISSMHRHMYGVQRALVVACKRLRCQLCEVVEGDEPPLLPR